jgi:O-antigen ligase
MRSAMGTRLRDLTDLDWWATLVTAGLLVVVPLAFYPGFDEQFSSPKVLLTEMLLGLGLAVWALAFAWGKVGAPKGFRLAAPLALLTVAALASCINSPVRAFSLQQAVYFACGPLWALLLISWAGGEESVRWVSVLATAAATFVAVIALLQWSGFDPLLTPAEHIDWGTMVPRMHLYSTFGNPDLVGGYLIGAFFPALALGVFSPKRWTRALGCGGSAAALAAIVGTGSRGAWAGLVAGLAAAGLLWKWSARACLLTLNPRTTKPGSARAYGFVVPAALGTVVFLGRTGNPWVARLEGRWFLWRSSWPMVWDHPLLGSGWGNFQLRFLDLQATFLEAHPDLVHYWSNMHHLDNDPLQLLLEAGLIGLAAFAWVLWAFARELQKAGSRESARIWIAASAGGVTAILIDSLFNAQFEVPPTLLLLFTLLSFPALLQREAIGHSGAGPSGSAAAKPPESRSGSARGRLKFHKLRTLASLAILLAAGALAVQAIRRAAGEREYALALRLEGENKLEAAEQTYRRGVALDPLNARLHFGLARALYRRGKSADALAEAELAERAYRDSHLVVLKARIEEQMGLVAQALETYRRALRLDPTLKPLQTDIERLRELAIRLNHRDTELEKAN